MGWRTGRGDISWLTAVVDIPRSDAKGIRELRILMVDEREVRFLDHWKCSSYDNSSPLLP